MKKNKQTHSYTPLQLATLYLHGCMLVSSYSCSMCVCAVFASVSHVKVFYLVAVVYVRRTHSLSECVWVRERERERDRLVTECFIYSSVIIDRWLRSLQSKLERPHTYTHIPISLFQLAFYSPCMQNKSRNAVIVAQQYSQMY